MPILNRIPSNLIFRYFIVFLVITVSSNLVSQSFHELHKGLDGECNVIEEKDGIIYFGGNFDDIDNSFSSSSLLSWNGLFFSHVGDPVVPRNSTVEDIKFQGNRLIVGGDFAHIGDDDNFELIAAWNGCEWESIGGGLSDHANSDAAVVNAIAINDDIIYAGGYFRNSEGERYGLLKYDGNSWQRIPSTHFGIVYALAFLGDDLYVAGNLRYEFTEEEFDGTVLKWNGTAWERIGTDMCNNRFHWSGSEARALLVHESELYIGGGMRFTTSGDSQGCTFPIKQSVVKYSPSTNTFTKYGNFGTTLGREIISLGFFNGQLIAGGGFENDELQRIVRWTGNEWESFGPVLDRGSVRAIKEVDGELFLGGDFINANDIVEADGVLRWGDNQNECNYVSNSFELCPNQIQLFSYDEASENRSFVSNLEINDPPISYTYEVAADGTETLELKHINGDWRIRNSTGDTDTEGSLRKYYDSDWNVLSYYTQYTAPTTAGSVIYLDYYPDDGCDAIISLVLSINPPPVLLLHGINSSGDVWTKGDNGGLKNHLISNGYIESWISNPTYDSHQSFLRTHDAWVHDSINHLLLDVRNEAGFANKVNIVGHSMGGLVARSFLEYQAERIDRFSDSKIDKLITLNTPHSGSELANCILNLNDLTCFIIGNILFQNDVTSDGVKSLRVDSPEILDLNSSGTESGARVHSITTTSSLAFSFCEISTGEAITLTSYLRPVLLLLNRVANYSIDKNLRSEVNLAYEHLCSLYEDHLGIDNDLVVRKSSQEGGLSGNQTTHFDDLIHIRMPTFVDGVTEYIGVYNRVIDLLAANDNDGSFATRFSPQRLDPPATFKEPSFTKSNLALSISGISEGQNLVSTGSWKLNVDANTSVNEIVVMYFLDDGQIAFDNYFGSSASFFLAMPPNFSGKMKVLVIGLTASNEISSKELSVNIINDNCPDVHLLNEGDLFDGDYRTRAGIISNSVVPLGGNVKFQARNGINLNPGFEIREDALFEAQIGNCN